MQFTFTLASAALCPDICGWKTVSFDVLGTRTPSAAHQLIESAAESEIGPGAAQSREFRAVSLLLSGL
jgi:hypothetical protein